MTEILSFFTQLFCLPLWGWIVLAAFIWKILSYRNKK
jgi:hypothetical protein